MTIDRIRANLQRPPVDISDMEVWDMVNLALTRLVPDVARLTLGWVGDMLRDEGNRSACEGRNVLAAWLREVGEEVGELYDTYYDWA